MKRLMIGLVLAVFLVGCEAGEKSKFSINENDSLETYAKNPIFTKVISADHEVTLYKFTDVPADVYGIKTSDLDVLGGYITIPIQRDLIESIDIDITMKGKASFDKLLDRANRENCKEGRSFEKGNTFYCRVNGKFISIDYDPLIDISYFSI